MLNQWQPTPDLKLVAQEQHGQVIQVIKQKWIREGFKDGETYVIESEWRELPKEGFANFQAT